MFSGTAVLLPVLFCVLRDIFGLPFISSNKNITYLFITICTYKTQNFKTNTKYTSKYLVYLHRQKQKHSSCRTYFNHHSVCRDRFSSLIRCLFFWVSRDLHGKSLIHIPLRVSTNHNHQYRFLVNLLSKTLHRVIMYSVFRGFHSIDMSEFWNRVLYFGIYLYY